MPFKISSTYEYILNVDSLGDNIQPPFLAGVKAGDILIMMWNINDDDKITIDDGWDEIPNTDPSEGTHEVRAFYHVATADGEQCSSYTNTYAGYLYMHTMCIRVDGTWSFVDSAATKQGSSSNTDVNYPELTATAAGQLVFYIGGSDADPILEGTHPHVRQISGIFGSNDSAAYQYVTTGAGTVASFQDHVDSDQTTALGFIIGDEGGLPPLDIQPLKALAPITDITQNQDWTEDIYASGYDIDTGELRIAETPTFVVYSGTAYCFRTDGKSGTLQIGETITFDASGNTGVLERQVGSPSNWYIHLSQMTGTTEADNATFTGGTSGATGRIKGTGNYQIDVTGLLMSEVPHVTYKLSKWAGYSALGITDGVYWIKAVSGANSSTEGYAFEVTSHASRYDLGTTVTLSAGTATGTLDNYGMCHFDHNVDSDNDYPTGASGTTGWKKSLVGSVKTFDTPKDLSDDLIAIWTKPASSNIAYMYFLAIDTSNRWKLWRIRSKYVGGYIYSAVNHNLISMSSVDTPQYQVAGFDASAVKKYGIMFRESSDTAKNGCSIYGQSIIQKQTVTGGNANKQVTFSDINNLLKSEVSAEGIAYTESIQSIVPSQFMLSRDLILSCNINMANQALSFPPQADGVTNFLFNVDANDFGLETIDASGNINTSLIASDVTAYLKNTSGDTIDYTGTILSSYTPTLQSGKEYNQFSFVNCGQITGGATLTNCNVSGHTGDGAVLFDGLISGGNYKDNTNAIEIRYAGDYTLNNATFTDNIADINPTLTTGTVNLTTNVAGLTIESSWTDEGGGVYTKGSATVNILAPQTSLTITNLVTDSIVKVTKVSNGDLLKSGVESSGIFSFDVAYVGEVEIEVRKASSAPYYQPYVTRAGLSGASVSVPALQTLD